jgi:ABC-type uncharacterized transport system
MRVIEKKKKTVAKADRRQLRFTTLFALVLSVVFAVLLLALSARLDFSRELPVSGVRVLSERTRKVLAETQGSVKIYCFMERRHRMFRPVVRLLKGLQLASQSVAGANIQIEFVDPRWDLVRAGQLAMYGVPVNALLFERQRRRVIVTLDEMMSRTQGEQVQSVASRETRQGAEGVFQGEMVCAAAISKLAQPHERPVVYWLQGHGEGRHDDYDALRGFSDIARIMTRDGYAIRPLVLAGKSSIPDDCRVLLIAGASRLLAAEESAMIAAYLQRGGRLFYMVSPRQKSGLEHLTEEWGIRVTSFVAVSPRTLSGQDVVVSAFAQHATTLDLGNASVAFGSPACLETLSSPQAKDGDRPQVMALAWTDEQGWGELEPDLMPRQYNPQRGELKGPVTIVALAERGAFVARDVAYSVTRICVAGETDFVMNGTLAHRANANRDFFMNILAWLSGIDAVTASSLGGDAMLVTGFDRDDWALLMGWACAIVPLFILLVGRVLLKMVRW